MAKRRSPFKLVCEPSFLEPGEKLCRWTCPDGGETAQFRARWRKDLYAILHPSTKQRGKWQLTTFDKHGPIGDVIRSTCEKALEDEGIDQNWKLEKLARRT
jgi:hypothetical protein